MGAIFGEVRRFVRPHMPQTGFLVKNNAGGTKFRNHGRGNDEFRGLP